MVGAQIGIQALGKVAFSATFGAFFTRATTSSGWAAIGRADLRLCGSHAGRVDRRGRPVADGAGGPGHDAGGARLHRAVSGGRERHGELVTAMCDLPGISYIRTTREATPVAVRAGRGVPDRREQDAARRARRSRHAGRRRRDAPRVPAAPRRRSRATGIAARVIDCYSVKPIDAPTLRDGARGDRRDRRGRGPPDRGRPRRRRAGRAGGDRPLSGRVVKLGGHRDARAPEHPEELRAWAGIDAAAIVGPVRASPGLGAASSEVSRSASQRARRRARTR